VSYSPEHPADWTLEQLAEDSLPPSEQSMVSEHVATCARCAAEVDIYRAMFSAMSELPLFEPSPEFAESVMGRVTVAKPAALPKWLTDWTPSSWQGWSALLALCMVPMAPVIAAVWWIATHPDWTFASLWDAGWTSAQNVGWSLMVTVLGTATESRLVYWGGVLVSEVASMPPAILAIAVLTFAIGIPLSAWTLYQTLRTPSRGTFYAH